METSDHCRDPNHWSHCLCEAGKKPRYYPFFAERITVEIRLHTRAPDQDECAPFLEGGTFQHRAKLCRIWDFGDEP